MSSRRTRTTSSTMTTQLYPENLRLSALLFRTIGLGLAIGALVLAIQISSHGGSPVFAYVASIWSLILNPIDIICLLAWTRIPPGGLIFLDTLAVGFCVGGILNNIVVKNNGDGDNGRHVSDGLISTSDWLLGALLAVHFIMIVSGAIDCCWMNQYARKRSRHGSSRSRSSRSETVTRVRVTRTASRV